MPIETKETSHIRREADAVRGQMDGLLRVAESEGRDFSRREDAQYHRLQAKLAELDEQMETAVERYQSDKYGMKMGRLDPREFRDQLAPDYRSPGMAPSDDVVLASNESMADWARRRGRRADIDFGIEPGELSLGKFIRGVVTGDWEGAHSMQAALMETGGSSGAGFLVPSELSAQLIDRVRNASRIFEAGAVLAPMTSNELSLARLTQGAAVEWKAESAPIAESDLTFDRVQLVAHTLPILIKLSVELFEDLRPESLALIEKEMAAALSLELDRVALYGSGTDPEPQGIAGQAGVGTDAAILNYDDVVDAVASRRALNYEPNAMIWNPATAGALAKLKGATNGLYLEPPSYLAGLARLESNQVQGSGEAFVGDFRQMLVGIRTDLRASVKVLDQRFIDTLEYGLVAWLRADIQLAHPEAFVFCNAT